MGANSVLLVAATAANALNPTCKVQLDAETCQASQYCTSLDGLAAEVANRSCNASCCPTILIYGCTDSDESLQAVLCVMHSVMRAQPQQAWTSTAETWQLQQCSNDGASLAFAGQAVAVDCVSETASAAYNVVQVRHGQTFSH